MSGEPARDPAAEGLILLFQGWAATGDLSRVTAYEDDMLAVLAAHGASVLFRGQRAGIDSTEPAEVHVLRFPNDAALAAFMVDDRRAEVIATHGEVFEATSVVRLHQVSVPPGAA